MIVRRDHGNSIVGQPLRAHTAIAEAQSFLGGANAENQKGTRAVVFFHKHRETNDKFGVSCRVNSAVLLTS